MNDDAPAREWRGKVIGAIAGYVLLRADPLLGALIGLLIGHGVDARWFDARGGDPYRVLGVAPDASDADIDLARRRLLARHHPDRAGGAARHDAGRATRDINAAYARIRAQRLAAGRRRTPDTHED